MQDMQGALDVSLARLCVRSCARALVRACVRACVCLRACVGAVPLSMCVSAYRRTISGFVSQSLPPFPCPKCASVYLALPRPRPHARAAAARPLSLLTLAPSPTPTPRCLPPAGGGGWQRASTLGVHYSGMRGHAELAGAMARAGFYLYPTNFPETSCIALMQVRDSLPINPDPKR